MPIAHTGQLFGCPKPVCMSPISAIWRAMKRLLLIILCCIAIETEILADDFKFRVVETGNTPLYDYYGTKSQDLSAAGFDGEGIVLLGFDGGRNGQFPEVRMVKNLDLTLPAELIERQVVQRDIEAMSYGHGAFYILSSLSQADEENKDFRLLTELAIDRQTMQVSSERYVYMRELVLEGLKRHFDDDAWFSRVSSSFGKLGGLNIEGLASVEEKGRLVLGLRSPLWAPNFGAPNYGKGMVLNQGEAILMDIFEPFSENVRTRVRTIPLKGKGVRGMEYVKKLGAYIIISGMVEKGNEYGLWLYFETNNKLIELDIPELKLLCRPEAIVSMERDSFFYVLSEQSGRACAESKVNFLKISYEN